MSKRFSPYYGVSYAHKKPKLDITIYKSDKDIPGPSIRSTDLPPPKMTFNDGLNNIWDDDDDDVILLASQAVEAIEKHSQQIIVEQQHSSNLDITFTKFGESAQTSTQNMRQVVETVSITTKNNGFDDDDGIFSSIEDYYVDNQPHKQQQKNGNQSGGNVFKVPAALTSNNKQNKPTNSIKGTTTDTKKKDARDIQLDYFSSRLDCLRKENEKLTKDLKEFNDKLQTKDGEVSTLRYEIRNLKQINDKLRLEKIQDNENVKKGWKDKIHELEKQLTLQQAELQFKCVELQRLKEKQFNTTQQLHNTSVGVHSPAKNRKQIVPDYLPSLCDLHLTIDDNLKQLSVRKSLLRIPQKFFKNKKMKRLSLSFQENLFRDEFYTFQGILAEIQNHQFLDEIHTEKYKNRITKSLRICLPELKDYIRNLKYPKYRDTSASVEYKFLSRNVAESASNKYETVFEDLLLFPEEKGLSFRRYFGALSLIGEYIRTTLTEIMCKEKIGEYNFLQILTENVELIGFSKELFHYFGLIESLGFLLKVLIKSSNVNEYDIVNYLKQLIFCRPNIRPLIPIVQSLNLISKQQNENQISILNLLCKKSDKNISISINDYYKIIQFSPHSCLLQIYGCLLEVAFDQFKILTQQQITYLTIICINHIEFIRNCIDKQPNWISNQIIDCNGDGDNNQQNRLCDCYMKLSTSFIILFQLILKHWINDANCVDFRKISKISRLGVLLLCNICKLNYRRELLQIGGSIIRNRIKIIYDWLNEHKNLLQFKSTHSNALEFIKTSHVMADLQNFEEISDQQNHTIKTDGENIWNDCVFSNFI